jgi:anti-sigma-K factor RskA
MNIRTPGRADALAAEYVLGTLRGRGRERFARLSRADPVLSAAVNRWEERLLPFADSLPPVSPPAHVWEAIMERIRGSSGAAASGTRPSFWSSLGLWRGVALAGIASAVLLAIALFNAAPSTEGTMVAVLAAQDSKPALVAVADRGGRFITVKAVAPIEVAADRTLQLWALPPQGNPRSLGLIAKSGIARLALPSPADQALQNVPTLAISLEPLGGSPTGLPTGPVLYTGPLQRVY